MAEALKLSGGQVDRGGREPVRGANNRLHIGDRRSRDIEITIARQLNEQLVVAGAAVDGLACANTGKGVDMEDIVAGPTGQRVGAFTAVDIVIAVAAID